MMAIEESTPDVYLIERWRRSGYRVLLLVASLVCGVEPRGNIYPFRRRLTQIVLEGQGAVSHDPRTAGSRISYALFFCTH
jgi:hypothetical protein